MCLLRVAPQDLPTSLELLALCLGGYFVFGTILAAVYYPVGTSMLVGITETALVCALMAGALHLQKLPERLPQTLAALAGTGAVLNVIALPLSIGMKVVRERGGDVSTLELLSFGLLFWSWAITAHILRHALSVRFGTGLGFAMVFFIITLTVMRALFPDPIADALLELER